MSKTSKRAILTIIVIATLMTVMIPIMPASAETVDFFTWETDGFADWTLDTSRSGLYSVKLDSAGPGAGRIRILIDPIPLSTLEDPSFWTYEPTVTNDGGYDMATKEAVPPGYFPWGHAYINILLDTDGSGVFGVWDDKMEGLGSSAGGATTGGGIVAVPPDASTWTEMQEAWGFYDMDDSMSTGFYGFGVSPFNEIIAGTLAEWKTAMPSADVMGIEITFGWTPYDIGPVYVDDVTINGETYTLETDPPVGLEGFTIDYVTPGDVVWDQVLTVMGSGVTAGSEVIAYWDYAGGTLVHPLNSTEGNPDGSYDLEVTVPSDVVGDHYLWVKDVATGATVKSGAITMVPKITLSPSSGLVGDPITLKGYGFEAESEVTIDFDTLEPDITTAPATVETDDDGYFSCTFDVPTGAGYTTYDITATDSDTPPNIASKTFTVGASITIDPEEGPSGTVVDITGVGWTPSVAITLTMDGEPVIAVDILDLTVDLKGEFSAEVVIPSMADEKKYDIIATELGAAKGPASTKFDVTGNSAIKVAPGYGPPGGSVEIKGYNFTQISGTEVTLTLHEKSPGTNIEPVDEIEVDSNGEFSETVRIPAVDYGTWEIWAEDLDYGLDAEKDFRIGIMIVIVSPSYGPTGTPMYLTGIGFSDGKTWNATMDGVAITDEAMDIEIGTEAISETIYIPTVPEGTYDITVLDIDTEIEVISTFVVTATTEAFADPASAPNEYKVIFEGNYFAQDAGTDLEFILFNATESWDITNEVNLYDSDEDSVIPLAPYTEETAVLDADGNFTAWWEVWGEEELSLGCYKVNVTDDYDLFAEISLCLVEARVDVEPRKSLFDRGDTIQFNVKNDFKFDTSYMKIWDPDENLYWETAIFVDWLKVGDLYTVPYYMQTSGGNLMELSQDAPLGTWVYVFYEEDTTQLTNGTFEVGESAESLLTEQIAALSEELGIDIDTLQTYIDDLGIDMDESVSSMAEQIATAVSGMEDDISGLSEDLDDAVTGIQDDISGMGNQMASLESLVDDISTTSTAAQEAANDAKNSADQSLEAAEKTQQQTSGLQGLVYGAIAASLIAALAAIVSLMQISRRIAG